MTTPSFASASLYVGDLNNDVTDSTLFDCFSQVGPVASIRICRDAVSRRSLGYAYVNFHSVADAERALDTLNFSPIKGRPCRVMWSQRDPAVRKSGVGNIFIKNLDKSIDNKQLYDTFSMFGNILSAKIAQSHDGQSLGYGFVHFDSDEAAGKAIAQVNGMLIKERNIVVAPFKPKSDRAAAKYTNLYVKNLPEELRDKEKLDALFGQYGVISNSVITSSPAADGSTRTFAFVNFETQEQAAAAIEALNEREYEGDVKLYVARAQKKAEREKELRDRFEAMNRDRQTRYASVNLYVKNLTDEMTDEELRTEFAKYGEITSAKIMRDEASGRSRGFGFVCFQSPEDSTRAVAEMNGRMVQNKPLYVAVAQRKDVRRAQLEMMRAKAAMMPGMYPPGAPLFYPGMQGAPRPGPGPAGFMYPPMMPNMRFPGGGRPPFAMGPGGPRGGMPAAPPGYTLVPAPMGAAGGAAVPTNRPPRGPRVQGGVPQQQQPRNANMGGASTRPAQGGVVAGGRGGAARGGAVLPGGVAPLTLTNLVNASPEMQKQLIGERLYPLIAVKQPEQAGKITGMLLEMDNAELLELLDSEEARDSKIIEALRVLQEAEATSQ